MRDGAQSFDDGKGSTSNQVITGASSVMRTAQSANQLANNIATNAVSLNASIGASSSKTQIDESISQSVPGYIGAGRDVNIDAGNDITIVGTQIEAGEDINLDAGSKIGVKSTQFYYFFYGL